MRELAKQRLTRILITRERLKMTTSCGSIACNIMMLVAVFGIVAVIVVVIEISVVVAIKVVVVAITVTKSGALRYLQKQRRRVP
jgi:hypothetical protein